MGTATRGRRFGVVSGSFLGALIAAAFATVPAASASPRVAWETSMASARSTLPGVTYRVMARVGHGGSALRVRLSNRRGDETLRVAAFTVGIAVDASSPDVRRDTIRTVSFAGEQSVSLPAGDSRFSDPVALPVEAGDVVAVGVYVPDALTPTVHLNSVGASHWGPRQFRTGPGAGDVTAEADGSAFVVEDTDVYFVDAIEVDTQAPASLVAVGDSLTDGACATGLVCPDREGTEDRYPDVLQNRLRAALGPLAPAVLNAGRSGDTAPSVLERLAHDVLELAGVTHAVILVGSNDLGSGRPATDIAPRITEIADQAERSGILPIVGTIPPRAPVFTPAMEAQRQELNDWLRRRAGFRYLVDFDAALRDPAAPEQMLPAFDGGDGSHPNAAGYDAMAVAADPVVQSALAENESPVGATPAAPLTTNARLRGGRPDVKLARRARTSCRSRSRRRPSSPRTTSPRKRSKPGRSSRCTRTPPRHRRARRAPSYAGPR